jgi:hypothetical protein
LNIDDCWWTARSAAGLVLLLCGQAAPIAAQTTGSILGQVVEQGTDRPLADVRITVAGTTLGASSGADGRFVIAAVPPGERAVRAELIGYRPVVVENLIVRSTVRTELRLELQAAPVQLEGLRIEAERIRLIEPEVSTTHEVIRARELAALPIDDVAEAVELTPGVSEGHFRGGRIGQEVYLIDGFETKNQFEASSQGAALELPPSALEEVEVITGGFGAQYGSALSGVVSYTTRRGSTEQWDARASAQTDEWAPDALWRGFTGLSLSAGGPLHFLGAGTTLYADVLAQARADADPRARGLACLAADEADEAVAALIREVQAQAPALYCPAQGDHLPHQRGDRLIGFARIDRPLSDNLALVVTLLHNRDQRELYTPEHRYNPQYQLGQRTGGSLASALLDWTRNEGGHAWHLSLRSSFTHLDRYLGVVDPWTFDGRARLGALGFGGFRFVGEDFVRSPIEAQLASASAVPGYVAPGSALGTPFGVAGNGIFFTEGTPDIANYARSNVFSAELAGEHLRTNGMILRGGGSAKLYRVESYERTLAHLSGSTPSYARFFPAVVSGFSEARFGALDDMTISLGLRVDAFRSGVSFRADRGDFLSPVIDPSWQVSLMPRVGLAMPIPGTGERSAVRFNFNYVSQPPDFRYFLDTAIGDSLRTDIRRQGNPQLSFERGVTYEASFSHVLRDDLGAGLTYFRKELRNLVTGSLRVGETGNPQYTTGDFGTVQGVELSLRAQLPWARVRAGYALSRAMGVASGAQNDSTADPGRAATEYPLAFDRRHSADVTLYLWQAAGNADAPWSLTIASSLQSGYPISRRAAAGVDGDGLETARLPWTSTVDARLARDFGAVPGCNGCAWRIVADGRNLLGRANIVALRRDTGGLGPTIAAVNAVRDDVPPPDAPIPAESPGYSALADLNGNGYIDAGEFRLARTAAALDRFDPSLFYGEARQVRLGVEVTF